MFCRAAGALDALDVGCGTGFFSLELAARGHRVTGVDFAPSMIALAEHKAAERGLKIRFEQGDAEQLPFAPASFDLVISRHVLWTLPHPEAAIDEWFACCGRAGGSSSSTVRCSTAATASPARSRDARKMPGPAPNTRRSAIGCRFSAAVRAKRSRPCCVARLANVGGDPLADLVEAQMQRMVEEGLEPRRRNRYVVWGDVRAELGNMQQGRGGMGSHKHGVSGHASQSPRSSSCEKACGRARRIRHKPARRPLRPLFATVRDAFDTRGKPRRP